MSRKRDAMSGPEKDPSFWQAVLTYIAAAWPQIYASGMAFVVALVRGLQAGGRLVKSLLEAVLCGCLALALMPVLDHFGLSQDLAVAVGAGVAFLGTDWFRERAGLVFEAVLGRWRK